MNWNYCNTPELYKEVEILLKETIVILQFIHWYLITKKNSISYMPNDITNKTLKNLNKEKYPEDFLVNSGKIFIWWLKPTQNLETFIVSFPIFA